MPTVPVSAPPTWPRGEGLPTAPLGTHRPPVPPDCPPPPLPEPRRITDWKWHGIFSDLMGWFSGDFLITQAGHTWIVAKMSERGVKDAPYQKFETMRAAFDAAEEILLGHTTT